MTPGQAVEPSACTELCSESQRVAKASLERLSANASPTPELSAFKPIYVTERKALLNQVDKHLGTSTNHLHLLDLLVTFSVSASTYEGNASVELLFDLVDTDKFIDVDDFDNVQHAPAIHGLLDALAAWQTALQTLEMRREGQRSWNDSSPLLGGLAKRRKAVDRPYRPFPLMRRWLTTLEQAVKPNQLLPTLDVQTTSEHLAAIGAVLLGGTLATAFDSLLWEDDATLPLSPLPLERLRQIGGQSGRSSARFSYVDVCALTGITELEIRAVVGALGILDVASVRRPPAFKPYVDNHVLRRAPVLLIDDDTFLVLCPWYVCSSIFELIETSWASPTAPSADLFFETRSHWLENEVLSLLQTKLGAGLVVKGANWNNSTKEGEIDVATRVGSAALFIECKSHFEPETKFGKVVFEPAEQLRRLRDALVGGSSEPIVVSKVSTGTTDEFLTVCDAPLKLWIAVHGYPCAGATTAFSTFDEPQTRMPAFFSLDDLSLAAEILDPHDFMQYLIERQIVRGAPYLQRINEPHLLFQYLDSGLDRTLPGRIDNFFNDGIYRFEGPVTGALGLRNFSAALGQPDPPVVSRVGNAPLQQLVADARRTNSQYAALIGTISDLFATNDGFQRSLGEAVSRGIHRGTVHTPFWTQEHPLVGTLQIVVLPNPVSPGSLARTADNLATSTNVIRDRLRRVHPDAEYIELTIAWAPQWFGSRVAMSFAGDPDLLLDPPKRALPENPILVDDPQLSSVDTCWCGSGDIVQVCEVRHLRNLQRLIDSARDWRRRA